MPLFTILTLFPDALEPYLACGVLGNARQKGLLDIRLIDFRDWTRNRHRAVDDRPYGGGPGMLLKPEPIVECVEWVEDNFGPHEKFALCPSGRPFRQPVAAELAALERCLLLCGRYEGFDQRIFELLDFHRLSIGDFVLAGGELPALCVLEAAARLLPGVLGNERSALEDSFDHRDTDGSGGGLDHPHYTRPRSFRNKHVPDVLLGGDHGAIERWRAIQARELTQNRQTDCGSAPPAPSGGSEPAAETERKNA